MGGIVYVDNDKEMGYIGINDIDRMEKRIRGYKLEDNLGIYTHVKNTSLETKIEIPHFDSANDLAKYISTEMVKDMEKVLAGGVCILEGKEFKTGIYNTTIERIDEWAKKEEK